MARDWQRDLLEVVATRPHQLEAFDTARALPEHQILVAGHINNTMKSRSLQKNPVPAAAALDRVLDMRTPAKSKSKKKSAAPKKKRAGW